MGRLLIFCDRGDVLARNFPRGPFHDEIERRGQDDSLCLGIGRPLDEVGRVLAVKRKPIHRQNGNGFGGAKAAPGEHFLPLKLHFDVLLLLEERRNVDALEFLVLLVEVQFGKDADPGAVPLHPRRRARNLRGQNCRGASGGGLRLKLRLSLGLVIGGNCRGSIAILVGGVGIAAFDDENCRLLGGLNDLRAAGEHSHLGGNDDLGKFFNVEGPLPGLVDRDRRERIGWIAAKRQRGQRLRRTRVHGVDKGLGEIRNIHQTRRDVLIANFDGQRLPVGVANVFIDVAGGQFLAVEVNLGPMHAISPADKQEPNAGQAQGDPLHVLFKEVCDFHKPPLREGVSGSKFNASTSLERRRWASAGPARASGHWSASAPSSRSGRRSLRT